MHLFESGEFLNVGLFCRVSCCLERDACFVFFNTCCVFFLLFDIFMYTFFGVKGTLPFFFFLRSCFIF